MPRYINVNSALQAHPEFLNEQIGDHDKAIYAKGWNACNSAYHDAIKEIDSVSPDEARGVGKWEKETICYSRCSNCKKLIKTAELVEYKASDGQGDFLVVPSIEKYDCNYCSNCGAKMEVE